jgi:hypothetical protein
VRPGLKFVSRSRTTLDLDELARFDSGGNTIVMPFQEATAKLQLVTSRTRACI